MRYILFLVAVLVSTGSARASQQDVIRGEDALVRSAACLFTRDQIKVSTLLISWPGSELENRAIGAMQERMGLCLPNNSRLSFGGTVLRGLLAEQALIRQFPQSAPLPTLPADWASQPLGNTVAPQLGALHALARCVVLASPAEAHALVRAKRRSADETAALAALRPALSSCIPADRQFTVDRPGLRGLLAEALLAALNRGEGAPIAATLHAKWWPPRD